MQYQKTFYSSAYYGRANALYGDYVTEIFDGQEPFSSTISGTIDAQLPSLTYEATDLEFMQTAAADWIANGTDRVTRVANSPIEFYATGDNIEIHVRLQNQGSQTIEAKLYKEEFITDSYQWVVKETKQLSTLSVVSPGTIGKILFSSFGYGNYKVVIKALNTTADAILVGGRLRTNDITFSVRTSADQLTWSNWEMVSLTKTLQGSSFLITGQTSTSYSNIRYIQGKVELYASDQFSSPVVERIELQSNDSGLYENDGEYMIQLNMNSVAAAAGKSFKKVNFIKWLEPSEQPKGTQVFIRSSSSLDSVFWGPITAPYSKSPHRLRLLKGATSHSIILGPINEGTKFNFSQTAQMLSWNAQAFSPKDPSDTSTTMIFSKTKTNQEYEENKLLLINDMNMSNKTVGFSPQPYFLTVKMSRTASRGTPVVDWITVDQNIQYIESPFIINKDISAVDQSGTGIKSLQKISDYGFSYPSSVGLSTFNQNEIAKAPLVYELRDDTRRPTDVILYFKSEQSKGTRTNLATSDTDEIMGKVLIRHIEAGEKTGVTIHDQIAQGRVQYLRPYDREMQADFTPSLSASKRYRYYLLNGWPDTIHVSTEGQTLSDIAIMYKTTVSGITSLNSDIVTNEDGTVTKGQKIIIPNTTMNTKVSLLFENGTLTTSKSGHNALYDQEHGIIVTDFSSEKISIAVPTAPEKGYAPWTSEVKIYSGVINFEDVRSEFLRTQYNRSTNSSFHRRYIVVAGDTWDSIASDFDVNSHDLQVANAGIELKTGVTLTVPPNIILPALAPEAEFETNMPYEITIIPDSVHKKDGTRIDESFIPISWDGKHLPLTVNYLPPEQSSIHTAEMTRGDMPNGMDPLPLSDVTEILSVKRITGGTLTYQPWDDFLQAGSYKLTQNYVDWSPSVAGSMEPAADEKYIVTYKRRDIDNVVVHLDTDYFERMGGDIVWRSPEVKVYDGVCTPTEDFEMLLPVPSSFEGYNTIYQNIGYVVEDNDLWVETKIETRGNDTYLIGTLNGKDPSKNWHPTINTGHYYLKEQEFYLYSEPMKTVLNEKELPTVEGIEYVNGTTGIGALLLPSGQNLAKDTVFESTNWKPAKSFTSDSVSS